MMWPPKQAGLVGGLDRGQLVSQSKRYRHSVPRTGTREGDLSLERLGTG